MLNITSIKDPLIKAARLLNKPAERTNKFLLEGSDAIKWALDADLNIDHTFVADNYSNNDLVDILATKQIAIYRCSEGIMKKINDSKFLVPIIAVAMAKQNIKENSDFVLMLENIHDQGNLGTIIRTAMALGIKQIITTEKSSDVFNKKTITASRGTVFNIQRDDYVDGLAAVQALKDNGYQVIATSPRGQVIQSLSTLAAKPIALIVGNETDGVTEAVMQAADSVIQISMANAVESLNVGVAAGISMYELKLRVLIAMISKNIRHTLGREIGVAHQLMQKLLDEELKQQSTYTSQQMILMMIMVCDECMSIKQIEKDIGCYGRDLDLVLEPLQAEGLIQNNDEDHFYVTASGEEKLAKLWHCVECAEKRVLSGFSESEKKQLNDFLRRIQLNCNL